MVDGICDIDKQQLATRAVRIRQGSQEMDLELCDYHFGQLKLQQGKIQSHTSDSNRAKSLAEDSFIGFVSQLDSPLLEDHEGTNLEELITISTKEVICQAAATTANLGSRVMGTEHLLYALADSKPVQVILARHKLKAESIHEQIENDLPSNALPTNRDEPIEITISDPVKRAFAATFWISRRLGHSYIGPEHLLAGLAQEPKSEAGKIMSRLGMSGKRLRQDVLDVADRTADKTGLLHLEKHISHGIAGQSDAIAALAGAVRRGYSGLGRKHGPAAVILLAGPSGTGKTESVKLLAQALFDDESALTQLNMTDFSTPRSVTKLTGTRDDGGYAEKDGLLTGPVRRKPTGIVLLDDIDKAHPVVIGFLARILNDGRALDAKGRAVDFTRTIIICTHNPKDDQLRAHFSQQFLDHFDEVIMYEALTEKQIRHIAELQLESVKRTARGQGIRLAYERSVLDHIVDTGYLPESGAWGIEGVVGREVEQFLAAEILGGKISHGANVLLTYDNKRGIASKVTYAANKFESL